jgi:hypothetical protein
MSARFLRHEGFLGAVGAFLKVHPMTPPNHAPTGAREPRKVRAQCHLCIACTFGGRPITWQEGLCCWGRHRRVSQWVTKGKLQADNQAKPLACSTAPS